MTRAEQRGLSGVGAGTKDNPGVVRENEACWFISWVHLKELTSKADLAWLVA